MDEIDTRCQLSIDNCLIELDNLTVQWPKSDTITLSDISFTIGHGGFLLAVVGQVGAGKV